MVNTPERRIAEEAHRPSVGFLHGRAVFVPRNEGRSQRSRRRGQPNKQTRARGAETQKPGRRDGGEQLRP